VFEEILVVSAKRNQARESSLCEVDFLAFFGRNYLQFDGNRRKSNRLNPLNSTILAGGATRNRVRCCGRETKNRGKTP
jgi:hypothetical protein